MWTLERGVSLVSQDLNPGLPDSVAQDPPTPFGWGQAEVSRVALGIAMGTGLMFGASTVPADCCRSRRTGSVSVSDWTATLFLGPGSLGGGGGRTSGVPGPWASLRECPVDFRCLAVKSSCHLPTAYYETTKCCHTLSLPTL